MTYPQLKLISFTMCAYVQRARIVLQEKNIPHQIEYIDLDAPPPWFYDVSPLEKVPVLLVDDQALFESMVICDYLDDISPGSLYPADPLLKARLRAWIAYGDSILDSVYGLLNAEQSAQFKQRKATILDRLDVIEEAINDEQLFGQGDFSMVDVNFAPMLRFLSGIRDYAGVDFYEDTPAVASWAERLLTRPSVVQSVPENYTTELPLYLKRPGTVLADHIQIP